MRFRPTPRLFTILVFGALCCSAQPKPDNSLCEACHEQVQHTIGTAAHGALACTDCHAKHDEYPHPAGVAKPECAACHAQVAEDFGKGVHGQALGAGNAAAPTCTVCHNGPHELVRTKSMMFRMATPAMCGRCHDQIAAEYRNSVHGKALANGVVGVPVCTDCHGEHLILPKSNEASPVNGRHIRETCGQCHSNVGLGRSFGLPPDRITSFDASFHGLALNAGAQTVANCASCHGIHNILRASDPRSTTYAKNLPATCGKCHPGAGERFAIGPIHQSEGTTEPRSVSWVRRIYLVMIPVVIGWMVLHNLGDWLRKLIRTQAGVPLERLSGVAGAMRMYPSERIQHALAALSFIVLCWTGFALKYPLQWWALPLVRLETHWQVRRWVHRGAGAVLLAVAVIHLVSLVTNRRLREHWMLLLPSWNDLADAFRNTAYNLGLTSRKPGLSPHSYIEKAEYWAVVWGTLVMGVTGLLLWGNNLALRWFPKTVLDFSTAVHFYEAVLAGMAIVVWHFYSAIFDPDVYPMDVAWLTGHTARQHETGADPEPKEGKEASE